MGADDLALKLYRTEILSAVELYFWQFFTHAFIRRLTFGCSRKKSFWQQKNSNYFEKSENAVGKR